MKLGHHNIQDMQVLEKCTAVLFSNIFTVYMYISSKIGGNIVTLIIMRLIFIFPNFEGMGR